MKLKQTISFGDVLCVPKFSDIKSRKEISTKITLGKINKIELDIPIIASPMDTVVGEDMLFEMNKAGALAIMHRYNTIEEQSNTIRNAVLRTHKYNTDTGNQSKNLPFNFGFAVGVNDLNETWQRIRTCTNAGANVCCIDVAHGHHHQVELAAKYIKLHFPELHLMAGNIATYEGAFFLERAGVDSIRVGIGGGSCCTTKIITASGVPTLQSMFDIMEHGHRWNCSFVLDGGITNSGDIVKALGAGATAVMVGSLLAGTDQAPGKRIDTQNGVMIEYRGMASRKSQMDWRGKVSVAEGVSTFINYKGSVVPILEDLKGGIQSGFSYSGARNLDEFQKKVEFILQSQSSQIESQPHILFGNK